MVSNERSDPTPQAIEPTTSPRISFSSGFLTGTTLVTGAERERASDADFEFLSGNCSMAMTTADELFFEGRILPFWQAQHAEKLNKVTFKPEEEENKLKEEGSGPTCANWFVDDDPSPRPPTCTVLWKELLRLKKHHPPGSSVHLHSKGDEKGDKGGSRKREMHEKRIKKGLERTRSEGVRMRPVVHVPLCTQGKNNALPLLFALRRSSSK